MNFLSWIGDLVVPTGPEAHTALFVLPPQQQQQQESSSVILSMGEEEEYGEEEDPEDEQQQQEEDAQREKQYVEMVWGEMQNFYQRNTLYVEDLLYNMTLLEDDNARCYYCAASTHPIIKEMISNQFKYTKRVKTGLPGVTLYVFSAHVMEAAISDFSVIFRDHGKEFEKNDKEPAEPKRDGQDNETKESN